MIILTLKNQVHLSESSLSIFFFPALKSIQPHLMAGTLLKLDVNPKLILWIVNFLVNHWRELPQVSFLSRQTRLLLRQNQGSRDTTNTCLSRQQFCRGKHTFVAKTVLVAVAANDMVNRCQKVCHQAALSSSRCITIGSPQGAVLSPIPFTLYADDCTGTDST